MNRFSRSPPGREIGLGSPKSDVVHWWAERLSAVALLPLTLWIAVSLIAHTNSDYAVFLAWLRNPAVAVLVILLLIVLFYHAALGLQVVIEDYIRAETRYAVILATRFGSFALAAAGIVATLGIAFGIWPGAPM